MIEVRNVSECAVGAAIISTLDNRRRWARWHRSLFQVRCQHGVCLLSCTEEWTSMFLLLKEQLNSNLQSDLSSQHQTQQHPTPAGPKPGCVQQANDKHRVRIRYFRSTYALALMRCANCYQSDETEMQSWRIHHQAHYKGKKRTKWFIKESKLQALEIKCLAENRNIRRNIKLQEREYSLTQNAGGTH